MNDWKVIKSRYDDNTPDEDFPDDFFREDFQGRIPIVVKPDIKHIYLGAPDAVHQTIYDEHNLEPDFSDYQGFAGSRGDFWGQGGLGWYSDPPEEHEEILDALEPHLPGVKDKTAPIEGDVWKFGASACPQCGESMTGPSCSACGFTSSLPWATTEQAAESQALTSRSSSAEVVDWCPNCHGHLDNAGRCLECGFYAEQSALPEPSQKRDIDNSPADNNPADPTKEFHPWIQSSASPEVVQLPEPHEPMEDFMWRRPVTYSTGDNKVYVGAPGAIHGTMPHNYDGDVHEGFIRLPDAEHSGEGWMGEQVGGQHGLGWLGTTPSNSKEIAQAIGVPETNFQGGRGWTGDENNWNFTIGKVADTDGGTAGGEVNDLLANQAGTPMPSYEYDLHGGPEHSLMWKPGYGGKAFATHDGKVYTWNTSSGLPGHWDAAKEFGVPRDKIRTYMLITANGQVRNAGGGAPDDVDRVRTLIDGNAEKGPDWKFGEVKDEHEAEYKHMKVKWYEEDPNELEDGHSPEAEQASDRKMKRKGNDSWWMDPWTPGQDGKGFLLNDGQVQTWATDMEMGPHHFDVAEDAGLNYDKDVAADLVIDPDGSFLINSGGGPDKLNKQMGLVEQQDPRLQGNRDFGDRWNFGPTLAKTAVMTLPQQQREWDDLNRSKLMPETTLVHQYPDGWTIHRLDNDDAVQRAGKFMRNCWQDGSVVPREFQDKPPEQIANMEFNPSRHHTLNDEHGLPRVAFFHQPSRGKIDAALPRSGAGPLSPEYAERLSQWKPLGVPGLAPDGPIQGALGEPEELGPTWSFVSALTKMQWYGDEPDQWQGDHSFLYEPESDTIHIGSPNFHHADIADELRGDWRWHNRSMGESHEDLLPGAVMDGYKFVWYPEYQGSQWGENSHPESKQRALARLRGFDPDLQDISGPENHWQFMANELPEIVETPPNIKFDRSFEIPNRIPFVFNPQKNAVYVGPEGAGHHVVFNQFPELEHGAGCDEGYLHSAEGFQWSDPNHPVIPSVEQALRQRYPNTPPNTHSEGGTYFQGQPDGVAETYDFDQNPTWDFTSSMITDEASHICSTPGCTQGFFQAAPGEYRVTQPGHEGIVDTWPTEECPQCGVNLDQDDPIHRGFIGWPKVSIDVRQVKDFHPTDDLLNDRIPVMWTPTTQQIDDKNIFMNDDQRARHDKEYPEPVLSIGQRGMTHGALEQRTGHQGMYFGAIYPDQNLVGFPHMRWFEYSSLPAGADEAHQAIAQNYPVKMPTSIDEFGKHIYNQEQSDAWNFAKVANSPVVFFGSEVQYPSDAPHGNRKPVIYNSDTNRLYVGAEKAIHDDLEQEFMERYDPSGELGDHYGGIRSGNRFFWYSPEPAQHQDVMEALQAHFPDMDYQPAAADENAWKFSADEPRYQPQIIEGTTPMNEGYYAESMANGGFPGWEVRRPFLYHPGANQVYVGQPGTHHTDLRDEFDVPPDLGPGTDYGTVWPTTGAEFIAGIGNSPSVIDALNDHFNIDPNAKNAEEEWKFESSLHIAMTDAQQGVIDKYNNDPLRKLTPVRSYPDGSLFVVINTRERMPGIQPSRRILRPDGELEEEQRLGKTAAEGELEPYDPNYPGKAFVSNGQVYAWKTDGVIPAHAAAMAAHDIPYSACSSVHVIHPTLGVSQLHNSREDDAELVAKTLGKPVNQQTDAGYFDDLIQDWHEMMTKQGAEPKDAINHTPGNYGKGIVLNNGAVHTWNTTGERGGPHHGDYLEEIGQGGYGDMGAMWAFIISPEGKYVLPDYWLHSKEEEEIAEEQRAVNQNIQEKSGLTPVSEKPRNINAQPSTQLFKPDSEWNFESKRGAEDLRLPGWREPIQLVEIPHTDEMKMNAGGESQEGWADRRPLIYHPDARTVFAGPLDTTHWGLFNALKNNGHNIERPEARDESAYPLGWIGFNPEAEWGANNPQYGWYGEGPAPEDDEEIRKLLKAQKYDAAQNWTFSKTAVENQDLPHIEYAKNEAQWRGEGFDDRQPLIYDDVSHTVFIGQPAAHHSELYDEFPQIQRSNTQGALYASGVQFWRNVGLGRNELFPWQDKLNQELGVKAQELGAKAQPKDEWSFESAAEAELGSLAELPPFDPNGGEAESVFTEIGKAILTPDQTYLWNTDGGGSPHHFDVHPLIQQRRGQDPADWTVPEGDTHLEIHKGEHGPLWRSWRGQGHTPEEITKRLGFPERGPKKDWSFTSSAVNIINVPTEANYFGEYDPHNGGWWERRPFLFDNKNVYLGERGTHHGMLMRQLKRQNIEYPFDYGFMNEGKGTKSWGRPIPDEISQALYEHDPEFAPQQEHEAQPGWEFQSAQQVMYHGTHSNTDETIPQQGLRGGPRSGVFLTDSFDAAQQYAHEQARSYEAEPRVYQVNMDAPGTQPNGSIAPPFYEDDWHRDSGMPGKGYEYDGEIPPERIRRVSAASHPDSKNGSHSYTRGEKLSNSDIQDLSNHKWMSGTNGKGMVEDAWGDPKLHTWNVWGGYDGDPSHVQYQSDRGIEDSNKENGYFGIDEDGAITYWVGPDQHREEVARQLLGDEGVTHGDANWSFSKHGADISSSKNSTIGFDTFRPFVLLPNGEVRVGKKGGEHYQIVPNGNGLCGRISEDSAYPIYYGAWTQRQKDQAANGLREYGYPIEDDELDPDWNFQSSKKIAVFTDWMKPDPDLWDREPHELTPEEFARHPDTLWHGSPTGEMGPGPIHVGTQKAAYQALRARMLGHGDYIGQPAGKYWDLGDPVPDEGFKEPWGKGEYHKPFGNTPKLIPVQIAPDTEVASEVYDDVPQGYSDYEEEYDGFGWERPLAEQQRVIPYVNSSEDEGSTSYVAPNKSHFWTYEDFQHDGTNSQRNTSKNSAADPYWLDAWMSKNGPYLYHCTDADPASIARKGLLPWDHPDNTHGTEYTNFLVPRPNHVYLTSNPSALEGAQVRVDLRKLDPENLDPDEDAMVLAGGGNKLWTWGEKPGEISRGDWADQREYTQPSQTGWSLENQGTIAHRGPIPPEALYSEPQANWPGFGRDGTDSQRNSSQENGKNTSRESYAATVLEDRPVSYWSLDDVEKQDRDKTDHASHSTSDLKHSPPSRARITNRFTTFLSDVLQVKTPLVKMTPPISLVNGDRSPSPRHIGNGNSQKCENQERMLIDVGGVEEDQKFIYSEHRDATGMAPQVLPYPNDSVWDFTARTAGPYDQETSHKLPSKPWFMRSYAPDDEAKENPIRTEHQWEPWEPGSIGKGMADGEGNNYSWKVTGNVQPRHQIAMASLGLIPGQVQNFYNIDKQGQVYWDNRSDENYAHYYDFVRSHPGLKEAIIPEWDFTARKSKYEIVHHNPPGQTGTHDDEYPVPEGNESYPIYYNTDTKKVHKGAPGTYHYELPGFGFGNYPYGRLTDTGLVNWYGFDDPDKDFRPEIPEITEHHGWTPVDDWVSDANWTFESKVAPEVIRSQQPYDLDVDDVFDESRTPTIYDSQANRIYIGQPGMFHNHLHDEFGLDAEGRWGGPLHHGCIIGENDPYGEKYWEFFDPIDAKQAPGVKEALSPYGKDHEASEWKFSNAEYTWEPEGKYGEGTQPAEMLNEGYGPPTTPDADSPYVYRALTVNGVHRVWNKPDNHMEYAVKHNIPFEDIEDFWACWPEQNWYSLLNSRSEYKYLYNQQKDLADEADESGANDWNFSKTAAFPTQEEFEALPSDRAKTDIDPVFWDQLFKNYQGDYYHLAPTEDRDRIQAHGLKAADPVQSFSPENKDDADYQRTNAPQFEANPSGVYVTPDPRWARGLSQHPKFENMDLWKINAQGISPYPDYQARPYGAYFPHDIEPDRLTLHEPYWPQQESTFSSHVAPTVEDASVAPGQSYISDWRASENTPWSYFYSPGQHHIWLGDGWTHHGDITDKHQVPDDAETGLYFPEDEAVDHYAGQLSELQVREGLSHYFGKPIRSRSAGQEDWSFESNFSADAAAPRVARDLPRVQEHVYELGDQGMLPTMRRPTIYDPKRDIVHIGPYGSHHFPLGKDIDDNEVSLRPQSPEYIQNKTLGTLDESGYHQYYTNEGAERIQQALGQPGDPDTGEWQDWKFGALEGLRTPKTSDMMNLVNWEAGETPEGYEPATAEGPNKGIGTTDGRLFSWKIRTDPEAEGWSLFGPHHGDALAKLRKHPDDFDVQEFFYTPKDVNFEGPELWKPVDDEAYTDRVNFNV